ncbi:MAG: hypothetical protein EXR55_00355 [Dehalococcoidia bacterium]|nr:hypothetical protein [Dehalococcoidia bacterium]
MDLGAWGFQDFRLLEGEEVVVGLGQHVGLSTSAMRDKALVLLTNRRAFYLARDGRRWQALVADLEEVTALEMGSAGKNPTTLAIGAAGLVAGVLGWLLLPPTPVILPWVAAVLAGAGAVLLVLFFALPEEGALVLRVGAGQVRLEVSSKGSASQISTLVDRLFTLKDALRRARAPQPAPASEPSPSQPAVVGSPGPQEVPPQETAPLPSEASTDQPLREAFAPPEAPRFEQRPADW